MADDSLDGPVRGLYRYPVKGLSGDPLDAVDLAPGETMPLDRAWAIENGAGGFDPEAPRPLPKVAFLTLMRNPRLAALTTKLDAESRELTIRRDGREVARGDLTLAPGRHTIETFFAGFMGQELRGPPRIVHAPGHSFSDVAEKWLHIVNLASVRALERELGRTIDPIRFRANVVADLALPWIEFAWVGCEIALGEARVRVLEPTGRCDATNASPLSGERDMDIPAALDRAFGHMDMGVYATVTVGGHVGLGDRIRGPAP